MTPDRARARLVADLVAGGELGSDWRPAFEQVPRHLFIPDTVWRINPEPGLAQGRLFPLRREDDPDTWLKMAYADDYAVTQVDDGHPAPEGGWEVTSSASAPSVVAGMLDALDIRPGMRVLEIGTGTGWNAALLAHRVGAESVTTLEVDPAVADQARAALDAAGFGKLCVVATDGALGWPAETPYDRLIATVGAREVPYTWVAQTAPGGRLVVPLTNSYRPPGLAVLTVHSDGTASGQLGESLLFMGMRSERVPRASPAGIVGKRKPDTIGDTELHPRVWAWQRDAAVAIGQRIGDGVRTQWQAKGDGLGTIWLLDPATRSWAAVTVGAEPPYRVRQGGPRRLFDEVADAYRWWQESGEPAVSDWAVTVGPDGQYLTPPNPR